jgi:hypothetical protein
MTRSKKDLKIYHNRKAGIARKKETDRLEREATNLQENDQFLGNHMLTFLDWSEGASEDVGHGDVFLSVDAEKLFIDASSRVKGDACSRDEEQVNMLAALCSVISKCFAKNGVEVESPGKGILADEMGNGSDDGMIELHFPVTAGTADKIKDTLRKLRESSQKIKNSTQR